jgi:hypothetical protein
MSLARASRLRAGLVLLARGTARVEHLQVGLSLCLLGACTGSLVERRIDELRATLADAERRGAAHCAPVELALSSVHLEFAQLELREGDEQRAERHLIVAEPNGKAALRRTQEGDCQPSAESAAKEGSSGSDSSRSGAQAGAPHVDGPSTTSRSGRVAAAQRLRRTER